MVVALLVVAGAWILLRLASVAMVVVVALFLVGTLSTTVEWLEKKGLKRGPSIALVFTLLIVALLGLMALSVPALAEQVASTLKLESRFLVPRIYGNALKLPSSVVLFSLLAGESLMDIPGALLALPVALAVRMLVEELRVELPGEDVDDSTLRASDAKAEREYEKRAEGVPAEDAAAIAMEIEQRREDTAPVAGK